MQGEIAVSVFRGFWKKPRFRFRFKNRTSPNTDPMATAPAIDKPSAADFPRPLAAVMVTVVLNVFSAIASMNFTTAFA